MNKSFFKNIASKSKQEKHTPLRTTKELAVEFGISTEKLAAMIRNSDDAPKPKIDNRHCCNGSSRKLWYAPAEVRTWFKRQVNKQVV